MKTLKINIHGMNCNNCAIGLENYLKKSGATDVSVNFATATARFSLRARDSLPSILQGIEKLGYSIPSSKKGSFSLEHKLYFSLIWTVPLFLHMFIHWAPLHNPIIQLCLCIPVFALGLQHFGRSALGSLRVGVTNMDVLVVIGITAAFVYSLTGLLLNLGPDYLFFEATATITSLVLLGNVIEHRSVKKTTSAIEELTNVQAKRAKKIIASDPDEKIIEVDASDIGRGDVLLVNTGDKIPADGEIIWGEASIDESMISGESLPVEGGSGRKVIGGTIVVKGSIKMRALAVGKDTMLSGMIRLVEEAQQNKPEIQRVGDKVSSIFVPAVLVFAFLTLSLSYLVFGISFKTALLSSIAVLVIACPCAMGLATPTAVMVGIGKAAKKGILFKGGSTIEQFAGIKNVVFDKTGTLTTGDFRIKDITLFTKDIDIEVIKGIVVGLEKHSSHPIAKSLTRELTGVKPYPIDRSIRETRGLGVQGFDEKGVKYELGSQTLVADMQLPQEHDLYLLKNDALIAAIDIKDDIKKDAASTIEYLHSCGIKTILLSGDRRNKCEEVAKAIGIQKIYYEKLPHEKLTIIEGLAKSEHTAFIGDGINDAPSLARATVGVSLTEASEAAIQSAQIVLLSDTMNHLKGSHVLARHTMRTIKQNLFWAFFYNTCAIPIAAVGLLNPMIAALAMAFSDVMVIGNSLRLKTKKIL